ncbi:transposase, partial [Escherichia coli]|uniref:transposase n=1 Tax=Escherichia coli TaxID=562 RepID=UPI00211B0AB4
MKKRNFSAEFKRESAQLVVDQNYTVADAASAMDVGLLKWSTKTGHRVRVFSSIDFPIRLVV